MSGPTAPAWDGARNLGDLGGLALTAGGTTAPGRVFRSAAPEWVAPAEHRWTEEDLDAALADRRPALVSWLRTFDVEAYLVDAGVDPRTRARLDRLLVD